METCGGDYDSCIEAYSGGSGGLVSVACKDDACGLQSRPTAPRLDIVIEPNLTVAEED